MTVQTEISKAVYVGDGETTTFAVPFYFFNSELSVFVDTNSTPLTEGTDYTITSNTKTGGSITFAVAPKSGKTVTIVRNVALKQLITFIEGENFPASDYEKSLDKITMALQQLKTKLESCIAVPHGVDTTAEEITAILLAVDENLDTLRTLPQTIEEIRETQENLVTLLDDYDTSEQVTAKINQAKPLCFSNITITPEDCSADETYAQYPYCIEIALTEATASMTPSVTLSLTDALSGTYAPIATAYNGGIKLYLNQALTQSTTISSIILI